MSKFIILDTETTGVEAEDRIIQLGMIEIDGRLSTVHNDFCKPDIPIKISAMEVHGITPEMIKDKPPLAQTSAYKSLQALNLHENFLLIHNAPFDLVMLGKEGFIPQMQVIDTLRCARHLYPMEEAHRLQYFRYKLNLYKKEGEEARKLGVKVKAHDAIGDVLVLKLFIRELIGMLPEALDFHEKMKKLVKLSTEPVSIQSPIGFGKHKGLTLQEIKEKDGRYLSWMLGNMANLDEDIRYTINELLKV